MSYTVPNTFASPSGNRPSNQIDANFSAVLVGLNNAFLVGTFAARPAPSEANGRYYFATDQNGGTLYRDNGTSWVQVAAGVTTVISPTGYLNNLGFTATVAANALTFTLTALDGTPLSVTNFATIAFRNATLATGQYSLLNVTSGITLTIPSGQAVGTVNAVGARLYLCTINNAGTVELAVWNPLNATGPTLLGINESGLVSTTAIATAPSAQVLYSTTARTNVAVRVIGYIEISEVTAGTWATSPTVLQLMGPGVRRTGDVIQSPATTTGAVATGTTTVPADDTIPQNTEGDQYMTLAITPTSVINLLKIEAQAQLSSSVSNVRIAMSLYQDAVANALETCTAFAGGSLISSVTRLLHTMGAGTTSSTTFKIRAGSNTAATTTFNGEAGLRLYGGVLNSYMEIREVFV